MQSSPLLLWDTVAHIFAARGNFNQNFEMGLFDNLGPKYKVESNIIHTLQDEVNKIFLTLVMARGFY